jgi:hypothetical protein
MFIEKGYIKWHPDGRNGVWRWTHNNRVDDAPE